MSRKPDAGMAGTRCKGFEGINGRWFQNELGVHSISAGIPRGGKMPEI